MQNINEELSGRIQTIINQTMYEKIELMQNSWHYLQKCEGEIKLKIVCRRFNAFKSQTFHVHYKVCIDDVEELYKRIFIK